MNDYVSELNRPVHVEEPLSPEKGGFLKAYMQNYSYLGHSANYITGYNPPIFDLGLKRELPKINVVNQEHVMYPLANYSDGSTRDLRVIPFVMVKERNLEFKDEKKLISKIGELLLEEPRTHKDIINESGSSVFLVSLDEIKDKSLQTVLDHFGREAAYENKAMAVFDDDKYAPAFEKIEKLLNHFGIKLEHSFINDKDPYKDKDDKSWSADHREPLTSGHANLYKKFHDSNFPDNKTVKMPYPINFRSENDYLKACAHLIGDCIFESSLKQAAKELDKSESKLLFVNSSPLQQPPEQPLIKISKHELSSLKDNQWRNMACDIAGTMIAAQAGVPVTQNDIKRFSVARIEMDESGRDYKSDQLGVKRAFDVAARVAKLVRDIDLSKDQQTEPLNKGLWDFYKHDHENLVIQMHTPSMSFIDSVLDKVQGTKSEDILKTVDSLVQTRVEAIAENKDKVTDTVNNSNNLREDLSTAAKSSLDLYEHFDLQPVRLVDMLKEPDNSSKSRER